MKIAKASKARVIHEVMVGITPEMKTALEMATEFSGMKASTYARQALLERLVRDQMMTHPAQKYAAAGAK
jgi:hypothetical protein